MLYAAKFWDSSILLSGRVNSDSKIIYDREPREMVRRSRRGSTVDGDPYPAVVDGRLVWILDGYTTTADYPMSNQLDLSDATSDSLTTETTAVAGAEVRQHQLHPQLRQGDGRRLRRHRARSTSGTRPTRS